MSILYLYVQTVTRQCFCYPNSQWGVTAHDYILALFPCEFIYPCKIMAVQKRLLGVFHTTLYWHIPVDKIQTLIINT